MRVVILVFDDVEVLDACGPFEVFSVANRIAAQRSRPAPFEVLLVASGTGPVTMRGGLQVLPMRDLDEVNDLDLLLVPGGVTDAVEQDERVLAWLRARAGTPWVASVCTGAFVLATAGLLVDEVVTTHWDDLAELARRWPELTVVGDRRWVRSGDRFTSAGISAGIDLALHLVQVLVDEETAVATARLMDYAWERSA